MDMNENIKDKVIIITGGSSGIGEETAKQLAKAGATVAVASRRKYKLDQVVKDIEAEGGKAKAYTVDVANRTEVEKLIADVVKDFGRIDVLVNNAGIMPIAPLAETRIDEWEQMIDVNIKGLLYGVAAALPIFSKQGSGHFVHLGSVAGVKVFVPGGSVYSGTKFAVHAISEGLRAESGGRYRVTTIAPGAIESELTDHTASPASRDGILDFYKIAIPADSVARAIVYAVEQPVDVNINQIVLRPTLQGF
jgi:NADP-dependent 3-hydroxy acid dehydrogenase YdfG